MAKTKPYHHGNLRLTLINAGLAILDADGEKALTLRKVARQAGVSHAAPYRHFKDKNALLTAIAQQGFQKLANQMQAGFHSAQGDALQQFLAIGQAYIKFAGEHRAHFKVMFAERLAMSSELSMDIPDKSTAMLAATRLRLENHAVDAEDTFLILVLVIQNCRAANLIKNDAVMQLAFSAWAMVHGIATLLNGVDFSADSNETATRLAIAQQSLTHFIFGLVESEAGQTGGQG